MTHSDEKRSDAPVCTGKLLKDGSPCGRKLFSCKSCGRTGCNHVSPELSCDAQAFRDGGRCEGCGKRGTARPVTASKS